MRNEFVANSFLKGQFLLYKKWQHKELWPFVSKEQPRLCFQHFRNSLPNHYTVTKWKPSFSDIANTMKRKLQSALKFRVTPEGLRSTVFHTS